MELDFLVTALTFSDGAPFEYPSAHVRVLPRLDGAATQGRPFIELRLSLTDATPIGATPQEVHDAALGIARQMLVPEVVARHLRQALDAETARQALQDAQLQAALGLDPGQQ